MANLARPVLLAKPPSTEEFPYGLFATFDARHDRQKFGRIENNLIVEAVTDVAASVPGDRYARPVIDPAAAAPVADSAERYLAEIEMARPFLG